MNQSELEANACNWCQARKNACERGTICFGFASHDWLRKWREFVNQSQSAVKQTRNFFLFCTPRMPVMQTTSLLNCKFFPKVHTHIILESPCFIRLNLCNSLHRRHATRTEAPLLQNSQSIIKCKLFNMATFEVDYKYEPQMVSHCSE